MNRLAEQAFRLGSLVLIIFLAAVPAVTMAEAAPASKNYVGPSTPIGRGAAHLVVRTDSTGTPQSVSVALSHSALEGLPTVLNKQTPDGAWEYVLRMPKMPVKTGYSEVIIDWNPLGHPPPHVYTVPHFDFHFYMISPAEVEKVHFTGPTDEAAKVSDSDIIPPGYEVVPETAINKMGVHALDTSAPELHGKPFTVTFIYGYYKNRLIFLEPMVTREFLLSNPAFSAPVKTPARYSLRGYYPTKYTVTYDTEKHSYVIELGRLKRR